MARPAHHEIDGSSGLLAKIAASIADRPVAQRSSGVR
jgi:hypothetical protein